MKGHTHMDLYEFLESHGFTTTQRAAKLVKTLSYNDITSFIEEYKRLQGNTTTVPRRGPGFINAFTDSWISTLSPKLIRQLCLSRAKGHLIVFANLAYLDQKLPGYAILRDILSEMQNRGKVVDVRDVLAMYPIAEDLRRLGRPFNLSPDAEKTGLFNQNDFEQVCIADIEQAQKGIAIFSGFVTEQRVAAYEAVFRRKKADGVAIRCVTRPPKNNGSIPVEQGKAALDGLEHLGCVVDTRGEIHEKVVVIDDEIVWFGSLNPLSHTSRTDEVMARIEGKKLALQISSFMALDRGLRPDAAEGIITSEGTFQYKINVFQSGNCVNISYKALLPLRRFAHNEEHAQTRTSP